MHYTVVFPFLQPLYLDQFGVGVAFVLHLHDFDHVKIDELFGTSFGDGEDGVDDDVGEDVRHFARELRRQRGLGDVDEQFALLVRIRLALTRGNFEILCVDRNRAANRIMK